MPYKRPPYLDPDTPTVTTKNVFGGGTTTSPVFPKPISIRENFRRCAARTNPLWVPNSAAEFNGGLYSLVIGAPEADFTKRVRHTFNDWFGVEWTFVPEVGGPIVTPGTHFMTDITEYKEVVKFPNYDDYDFAGNSAKYFKDRDPEKILTVDIGLGCTERLVALMGGYTDAMVAMALEPEATRAFFEDFVDSECEFIDRLLKCVPADMLTYHDDWGTERDTFFGEEMMETLLFEPTKRLFDHIKSKGVIVELHSCGNIKRFVPYMIDMGVDFMQIQARANNVPALKEEFGDRIGIDVGIAAAPNATKEELLSLIRDSVDTYAKGGGYFTSVRGRDAETSWDAMAELYYYSREYYEK